MQILPLLILTLRRMSVFATFCEKSWTSTMYSCVQVLENPGATSPKHIYRAQISRFLNNYFSDPISIGMTMLNYRANSNSMLSFKSNQEVRIISKPKDGSSDLWGVEVWPAFTLYKYSNLSTRSFLRTCTLYSFTMFAYFTILLEVTRPTFDHCTSSIFTVSLLFCYVSISWFNRIISVLYISTYVSPWNIFLFKFPSSSFMCVTLYSFEYLHIKNRAAQVWCPWSVSPPRPFL